MISGGFVRLKKVSRRIVRTVLIVVAIVISGYFILGIPTVFQDQLDRQLISAVKERNATAVTTLLNQGANVNAVDKPFVSTIQSVTIWIQKVIRGKSPNQSIAATP